MDKSKNLLATLELLNDRVQFQGQVEGQQPVSIDYTSPVGDNQGYTSLELLLLGLSSCMATALLLFLRRSGKVINGLSVKAEAERQQEHPTLLTSIHLRFYFLSSNLTETEFERSLALSEQLYCPVFAMLDKGIKVVSTCHISVPGQEN